MARVRRGKYTKNPRRDRQVLAAIDAGVMAAAARYREAVWEYWDSLGVMGPKGLGYLHGDDATGQADHLQISAIRTSRGKRVADVYSPAERDGHPYPVYWELGHDNYFTKNTEQVEVFGPALFFYRDDIIGAMARQISARFHKGERDGIVKRMVRAKSGMIQVSEP